MISQDQARDLYFFVAPMSSTEAREVEALASTILRLYEFVDEIEDIHNHWNGGHGRGPAQEEIAQALFRLRYGPSPEDE